MMNMRTYFLLFFSILIGISGLSQPSADVILNKIEKNLSSENRKIESRMTIHGKRTTQSLTAVTYSVGSKKSFTEYLSPAREKGSKMLKLENQLWIYSPQSDRIIQLSGHMLRQSMMGSDLSWEDMMDDRKISETYKALSITEDTLDGRDVYLLDLEAKVQDVAYAKRKMWVDSERFVPLKEELFSNSGKLLKQLSISDVRKIGQRWFPMKMRYRDMMTKGEGTEFEVLSIEFNIDIPEHYFTKAILKK